jgi:hypothetical protein
MQPDQPPVSPTPSEVKGNVTGEKLKWNKRVVQIGDKISNFCKTAFRTTIEATHRILEKVYAHKDLTKFITVGDYYFYK